MKNNQLENQVREEIINYLKTNRLSDRVTEYEIDLSKYDENTLKIIDYYLRNVDTNYKVIFTRQVIEDILGFSDITDDEMIENFCKLVRLLIVTETYGSRKNEIYSLYHIFSSLKTCVINEEIVFILEGSQFK